MTATLEAAHMGTYEHTRVMADKDRRRRACQMIGTRVAGREGEGRREGEYTRIKEPPTGLRMH